LSAIFDWNAAIKSKHGVDVVYLDFAKAFDSVVHSKLIVKLRSYGVSDLILRWIDAFLSHRSQYVRIDSCVSGLCNVISGVPQGSVLGPALFIVYVNDITDCIASNVTVKLFADDTKLYSVITEDDDNCAQLQHSLDLIATWAEHWQLKLSPKKCVVMHIHIAAS
jgi:ribonuclease P/MRP protein subunit RPP40